MTGDRLQRAASAAEQLSGALWELLSEQAAAGNAQEAQALCRRVIDVCESFGAIALAAGTGTGTGTGAGSAAPPRMVVAAAVPPAGEESPREPVRARGPEPAAPTREPDLRFAAPATLVDEYEGGSEPIAVTDVRTGGHPPVAAAIERRLQRHALDGAPFSVLLVEVLDVERLQALRPAGDVLREISAVESAIAEQLRPADTLLREIDGRWWLIAPETDAPAARQLAERLAATARRFAHRGAPLRVVIGVAVCPEHGLDAQTLIGHADVDLYAAQAAGQSIGGGFDDEPRSA
ncbi:MAG: diguanylate cyclase domain-containing protein [Solirubrobacteraceae bacterium]